MPQTTQFKKAGQRLRKHAERFATQTRTAGVDFLANSKGATVEFANEINSASTEFVRQTTTSTSNLGQAIADETKVVTDLTRAATLAYAKELRTRFVPTRTKVRSTASKVAAKVETAKVPIRNYDALNAKDVVARIQRLSGPKASAVLAYERASKKRATVIRAAEQRLKSAAAS